MKKPTALLLLTLATSALATPITDIQPGKTESQLKKLGFGCKTSKSKFTTCALTKPTRIDLLDIQPYRVETFIDKKRSTTNQSTQITLLKPYENTKGCKEKITPEGWTEMDCTNSKEWQANQVLTSKANALASQKLSNAFGAPKYDEFSRKYWLNKTNNKISIEGNTLIIQE